MNSYSFYITLFILFSRSVFSQNLIPNPSFELSHPTCYLLIDNQRLDIQFWARPTKATSDLYSTQLSSYCDMHMPIGTAANNIGEQLPRTGNVIGGFVNEARPVSVSVSPFDTAEIDPYREYFMTPLITPLEVGKTYCASAYVSLPGNNDHYSNNISMYFSDTAIAKNDFNALYGAAQIIENKAIDDTTNWVLISGCFIADKPYQYLTVNRQHKVD